MLKKGDNVLGMDRWDTSDAELNKDDIIGERERERRDVASTCSILFYFQINYLFIINERLKL